MAVGNESLMPSSGKAFQIGNVVSIALFLLMIVATFGLFAFRDWSEQVRDALIGLGPLGPAVYILVLAIWTLTTVTSIPLMGLSGVVFGAWQGTLYTLIGGLLGSTAAFWIGRTLARRKIEIWKERHLRLRRLIQLAEKHSVATVVIIRMVAIFPLTLLHYALGATRMRFSVYVLVSLVMMLPGAALYAGVGDLARRAAFEGEVSLEILIWIGVAAVISAALFIYAKRESAALNHPELK